MKVTLQLAGGDRRGNDLSGHTVESDIVRGTHLLETAEGGRVCQMLWCGDTGDICFVKTVSRHEKKAIEHLDTMVKVGV